MSTNTLPQRSLAPQSAFSGILREDNSFAKGDPDSMSSRIDSWFDRLMMQCGWGVSPVVVLMACAVCAVALGGALFVWRENPLLAAVGALFGAVLPILGAMAARASRQKEMNRQLPGMIDELNRAAKSGKSIESSLEMVAHDTPAPLGEELKLCTSRMALGLPLTQAIEPLPSRTGLVASSVLVTALGVHRQAGGDITKVLDRLARTIRDREQFQGRLSAATRASQLTAFLMVGLPPIILAFFLFRDPEYFNQLMESRWGRLATALATVLMVIGSAWVWRILSTSRKA